MSNVYVRSTDGSNTDNGSTWALAKATLVGSDGVDAAGDTIWFSQSHAESTGSNVVVVLAGTLANPQRLLCGNDGAEPPTALATTGVITTTSNGGIALSGNFYCYGLSFKCGSGNNIASINLGNGASNWQRYENCDFWLVNTQGSSAINMGTANQSRTEFVNCNIKLASVAQGLSFNGDCNWNGGAVVTGSSSPTTTAMIKAYGANGGRVLIENVDFSNFTSGTHLSVEPTTRFSVVFRRCKLPGSWSGNLVNTTMTLPGRISMYNCDSGNTNYKLWIEDYAGQIKSETTLVMTNGASDGTRQFSWKMTGNANTSHLVRLASDPMVVWCDTTGSARTVTVDLLHDSATNLADGEVWLEVEYLGNASYPIGSHVTDFKADVLATAADQTSSSATWTTTGMTNPNTQKLSVTLTPQQKGFFHCRVILAKASKTIYVNPSPVVA